MVGKCKDNEYGSHSLMQEPHHREMLNKIRAILDNAALGDGEKCAAIRDVLNSLPGGPVKLR